MGVHGSRAIASVARGGRSKRGILIYDFGFTIADFGTRRIQRGAFKRRMGRSILQFAFPAEFHAAGRGQVSDLLSASTPGLFDSGWAVRARTGHFPAPTGRIRNCRSCRTWRSRRGKFPVPFSSGKLPRNGDTRSRRSCPSVKTPDAKCLPEECGTVRPGARA